MQKFIMQLKYIDIFNSKFKEIIVDIIIFY
jgi:hypothetical protein